MGLQISFKCLKFFYSCTCVAAAIGFVIWGVYRYSLDEDITRIDVKNFNADEESIYPSVSLFFYSPCIKEKFEKQGNGITPTIYKRFLQGDEWNENLMDIDYNDVTINIIDYFLGYEIAYIVNQRVSYNNIITDNSGWKPPYSNGNSSIGKAFTVDIPFQPNKKVKTLDIKLSTKIFPNQIRPTEITTDNGFDGFSVNFNYPKQLLAYWVVWPKI